jgi:hypothetical protein
MTRRRLRAAAPGRKQGPARRETRRACVPSMPAQAGMEPRHVPLSEGRSPYPASGVSSCLHERRRQQMLVRALLLEAEPASLHGWLGDDGSAIARGLDAHASHAGAAAERALSASFPTVRALLGEASFAALSRAYWHARPPARGDLFWLGEGLPGFIGASEQLDGVPYLADCARLDWLVACAEVAADASFEPDTLALLAAHEPADLALELPPGSALLASRHPVASIRRAHEGDSGDGFAVAREALDASRGEQAFVWRRGWRGEVAPLAPAEAAFMSALLANHSLAQALDAAGEGFDFAAWLARALEAGWLCAVRTVAASCSAGPRRYTRSA